MVVLSRASPTSTGGSPATAAAAVSRDGYRCRAALLVRRLRHRCGRLRGRGRRFRQRTGAIGHRFNLIHSDVGRRRIGSRRSAARLPLRHRASVPLRRRPATDPAIEGGAQLVERQRLGQVVVHPGRDAALVVFATRVRRQRQDRRARPAIGRLAHADDLGGLDAVHVRHVAIHQDHVVARRLPARDGLLAVVRRIDLAAQLPERLARDLAVHRIVLGDQDAGGERLGSAASPAPRSPRATTWRGWWWTGSHRGPTGAPASAAARHRRTGLRLPRRR